MLAPAAAATQPIAWTSVRRLIGAAGAGPLRVQLALQLSQALLPLAGLLAMRAMLDAVADGLAGRVAVAAATSRALLATGAAAAIALAGSLLRAWSAIFQEDFGRRLGDANTTRLQDQAARLDLAEFDRPTFHDELQRAGSEVGTRPIRLAQDLTALAVALLSLVLMAFLLVSAQPVLPLLVAACAAPVAWIRRHHARRAFAWQASHVAVAREVGHLGGALIGRSTAKDVRVLGLRERFAARLEGLRAALRDGQRALARGRAGGELFAQVLASLGLFGCQAWLVVEALAGATTLGGLVLMVQAAQRVQGAVRDLLGAAAGVHEHRLFLRPLVDFLQRTPAQGAGDPPAVPAPGAPSITARGLAFTYPAAPRRTLVDVQFAIAAGERVALVGANGSGKSTLVKLLARLYDPDAGELSVAGAPLGAVDPAAWRRRLSVLLQDASTFELSLRDNLTLGGERAPDDAALWRALDLVGLREAVARLPQGLDTLWSRRQDGGTEWSGGEARRLALARALAQPADVLLLDEPFAALDGAAAERIAAALRSWPRSQTVLVVDHRPIVLAAVDRVLFLADGRLVDSGPPAEVAARQAGFRALFPGATRVDSGS